MKQDAKQPDLPEHPGEVLYKKMQPSGITVEALAAELEMSPVFLGLIVRGEYTVSEPVANKLEKRFGEPVEFWLSLQEEYDKAFKKLQAAAN